MPLEIFSVMKLHSLVKMLVKDSTQCVEKKQERLHMVCRRNEGLYRYEPHDRILPTQRR